MMSVLKTNVFIEDLEIKGNNYINQALKETLIEEVRKNLLIKEFIVP